MLRKRSLGRGFQNLVIFSLGTLSIVVQGEVEHVCLNPSLNLIKRQNLQPQIKKKKIQNFD